MKDASPSSLVPGLPEHLHLVGVGGAGLSGAARILFERGHTITGQDAAVTPFTESLLKLGIAVQSGESPAKLSAETQGLVRSAAVPLDDSQVAAALATGLPVLKYAELLGLLAPQGRGLGVAGTHGKTTTSWLLYHALRGAGKAAGRGAPRAGALIGGTDRELGTNAITPDDGGWFAMEACEYDRSFLHLAPAGAVITNVEADHLDYYGTLEAIEEAFARFADRVDPNGLLVVGPDVAERVTNGARVPIWRLGHELKVELCGEERGCFHFRLIGPGWATPEVELGIPGAFNVENAALALGLVIGLCSREWHLDPRDVAEHAARTIGEYKGAGRRFEPWGTIDGIEVIHDYAHHPTEVRVTVEAARRVSSGGPLHVLFQPHQHSRTARFLGDFVESLRGVERVVVADVYGARKHIDEVGAGSEELASRLRRAGVEALAGGDLNSSLEATLNRLPTDSTLLVLGAGDIDSIQDDLLEALSLRSTSQRRPVR